jgi:hypothetical protein
LGDAATTLVRSSLRPPRLPDTKAALAKAVYEVNNLPAPVVPTADQVLPVQTTGRYPRPRPAQ